MTKTNTTKIFLSAMLALLASCGGQASLPQPTAQPVAATATQAQATGRTTRDTVVPQQANAAPLPATPTSVPKQATAAPVPTATIASDLNSLQQGVAFYQCQQGLCRIRLDASDERVAVALPDVRLLRGFALSANATQLVYALDQENEPGTAQIFVSDLERANQQRLFLVQAVEDGAGNLTGFGVLGFRPDGNELIVEHQAQLWRVQTDATPGQVPTQAISITEQLPYGASSSHSFVLSPDRTRILFTATGQPNFYILYDVATAMMTSQTLPNDMQAVGFGANDNTLIVVRFDPPVDPNFARNPATIDRQILGYETIALDGSNRQRLFDVAKPQFDYPLLCSNVVSNYAIFQSDDQTFFALNMTTGKQTPLRLPGYVTGGDVRLAFTQK